MKINNIGYLLKEGVRGIFLHGFMSFAAICVTVACLVIVGSFSILTYNVNIMVEDLNKTNEILAYVDSEMSDAEARSIGTKINMLDNVLQANFVSREEALEDFIKDHDYDPSFNGLEATDLRHRFVIVLEDNRLMEETDNAIKNVPGIVKTSAAYEMAEGFSTIQDVLHIVSLGVIAVLLVVSLLIISNTVKLAMYDRKNEIAIMKMVGATNGFIRWPFVYEGFLLGLFSAAIGFLFQWGLYEMVAKSVATNDTLNLITVLPFEQMWQWVAAVFLGAGMLIGVGGSLAAIRKFLQV